MPESVALYTAAQYAALLDAQVGKPYILGQPIPHNAPAPRAFDCSGLIIWANGKSGAHIMGDDTAAGLYNRSVAVKGEPKPGDMVFLANNPARANRIGHVAVLTQKLSNGDWRIVEARGRASGVVRTTLSYWRTRRYYTGIRRLPGFRLATATVPPPAPGKVTGVNVTTYNCLDPRFGGKGNDDAKILARAGGSVHLLTEAPQVVRNGIRVGLGGYDKVLVWTRDDTKPQAIAFRRSKWQHGPSSEVERVKFGPTSYHGGLAAVLTDRVAGRDVLYGALHLPPTAVATEAGREKYLDEYLARLDARMPTIIGGDFNTKAALGWLGERGWSVLPTGATTDKGKRLDFLAARNGIDWIEPGVTLDPGSASDHLLVKGKARTRTTIPTN